MPGTITPQTIGGLSKAYGRDHPTTLAASAQRLVDSLDTKIAELGERYPVTEQQTRQLVAAISELAESRDPDAPDDPLDKVDRGLNRIERDIAAVRALLRGLADTLHRVEPGSGLDTPAGGGDLESR